MKSGRFRIELLPIDRETGLSTTFDAPDGAEMKQADIWYIGDEPHARVLWLEPDGD